MRHRKNELELTAQYIDKHEEAKKSKDRLARMELES
jgi:hypothetical protein